MHFIKTVHNVVPAFDPSPVSLQDPTFPTVPMDTPSAYAIKRKLWEDPTQIMRFCDENPMKLDDATLDTVHYWRCAIHGVFMVVKHMGAASICVELGDSSQSGPGEKLAYLVHGISYPLSDLFPRLPAYSRLSIIPFEGFIIDDGVGTKADPPTNYPFGTLDTIFNKYRKENSENDIIQKG